MPQIFLIYLFLFCSISACIPAQKKVALPGDRGAYGEAVQSRIEPPSSTVAEEPQEVPEILSNSFSLEAEKKYQHSLDGTMAETIEEESLDDSHEVGEPFKTGEQGDYTLLNDDYVKFRLGVYQEKLLAWNNLAGRTISLGAVDQWPAGWHECVQGLEYMAFGYGRLLAARQPREEGYYVPMSSRDIVLRDIQYLESGCDKLFAESRSRLVELLDDFQAYNREQLRYLINGNMEKGDYAAVVEVYKNFISVSPEEQVSPDLKHHYAKALVYSGKISEAASFLAESLGDEGFFSEDFMEGEIQVWQAAMDYADLLLALGRDEQAKELYLEIDDYFAVIEKKSDWGVGQLHFLEDYSDAPAKYRAYVQLMNEFVRADGRGVPIQVKDLYSQLMKKHDDLGLQSGARRIMRRLEEESREWADKLLRKAESLAADHEFDQAREVLAALHDLPDGMQEEADKLLKQIEVGQRQERRNRRQVEAELLVGKWQDALTLYELKQYDKAIVAFSDLLESDYAKKAQVKIDKAVSKYAANMRREAATIFVRAQKSRDPKQKIRLLLESKAILVQLLESYPDVDIAKKISRNLVALEEQMVKLNQDWPEIENN